MDIIKRGGGVWGNIMYYVARTLFPVTAIYFVSSVWFFFDYLLEIQNMFFHYFNSGNYLGILEGQKLETIIFLFFWIF